MRISKTLLRACLALLLGAQPAAGQLLWQATTGTAAFEETSASFLAVPGGYLHVGRGGRDGTLRQPGSLYLAKISEAGAVLWQRGQEFRTAKVIYSRAAVVDARGDFYVTAFTFNTPESNINPSSGLLVKFTAAGDTIWTRRVLGRPDHNAILDAMVLTPDEGVVVLGGQGPEDSFIAKYSLTGQLLWRRPYRYSAEYPGYLWRLTKLPSGFLVSNLANQGGLSSKYLLLDEEGRLVAEKPGLMYPEYSFQPDRAGNVLAPGGNLSKISPAGDIIWSRSYRLPGDEANVNVLSAAETPQSGRYLLAGTRGRMNEEDLVLLLVDKEGTLLRDTLFYRPWASELPSGVAFDAQGNYVIGGYATQGPLGRDDQFALKLRSWDRLLPTATRPGRPAPAPYRLYPNPSTGDELRVATAGGAAFRGAYEVRDNAGRLVQAGHTAPGQPMRLPGLPPGLYLVRLRQGDTWLPALRLARQ